MFTVSLIILVSILILFAEDCFSIRILQSNLDSGLIGRYDFVESFRDFTQFKNDAEPFNNVEMNTNQFGDSNGAVKFNGANYLQINNTPQVHINNSDFTISLWVKPGRTGLNERLVSKGAFIWSTGYMVRLSSTTHIVAEVDYSGSTLTFCTSMTACILNSWNHVTVVADRDSGVSIYINGTIDQVCTSNSSGYNLYNDLGITIGMYNNYFSESYVGEISHLRIYDRVLNADEVLQLIEIRCISDGTCWSKQCLSDNECSISRPICNTMIRQCMECFSTADCRSHKYCDSSNHLRFCKECNSSLECPSTKPFCDQSNFICRACNGSQECGTVCTGKYAYWNGTCIDRCTRPFLSVKVSQTLMCVNPCNDKLRKYTFINGACTESCPKFFGIQDEFFCTSPCDPNTLQFLKWNGDCVIKCDPDLIAYKYQGNYFCDLPEPDFEVFQSEDSPNYFILSFNQDMNSTFNTISTLLHIRFEFVAESSFNYTLSPSSNRTYTILIISQRLISKQNVTFIINGSLYNYAGHDLKRKSTSVSAKLIYSESELQQIKKLESSGKSVMISLGSTSVPLAIVGNNPVFLYAMINLVQNYYYLLLINVNFPLNLNVLLGMFKIAMFKFLPNLFLDASLITDSLGAPSKFEDQDIDSFFLKSGGENLSLLIAYFVTFVLILGSISRFTRNLPFKATKIALFFTKNLTKNLLSVFEGVFVNLNIAAFLQLSNMHVEKKIYQISSGIAFLCISLSCSVMCHQCKQGIKAIKFESSISEKDPILNDHSRKASLKKFLPFIDLLMKFLQCFSLVFLYNHQTFQISMLVLLRIFYFGYIVYCKPFPNNSINLSQAVSEGLFGLALMIVVIIYNMDDGTADEEEKKIKCGYVIVGLAFTTFIALFLILMVKSGREIVKIIRKFLQKRGKKSKNLKIFGGKNEKYSIN